MLPPSSSLPPALAAFLQRVTLQTRRHRFLAPLLALALARFVYHRRRRHLEQLRLHRVITKQLALEFDPCMGDDGASSTPMAAPMEEWHVVSDDGTQAASLVYYPMEEPAKASEKVLVLLIPGNPGVPHYYLPLMQELVTRHGRRHEVRCLSHASHFMPWKNNGRTYSLQEQLDQKAYYLKMRLHDHPKLRFVVIGHSIGSLFVLDIARRFPQQIARLVLMQPTIMHMAQSAKGQQMMPLFRNSERSVAIVALLEYLVPMAMRHWIVRQAVGVETSKILQLASLSLVNTRVMRNCLGMALNEMEDVKELDEALVAQHEHKTLFVYSPVDDWVPAEFVQEYQLRFPKAQHRVVPQPHAFMMERNGTRDMAAHISRWIGDVLDDKQVRPPIWV
ncbi:hypothetical protein BBJ28_00011743 [Nothophytophthora sp. Chile5]|nr:hypothetical protein BBJ28_00011743 [Nothophytophthora sp. Chile5]